MTAARTVGSVLRAQVARRPDATFLVCDEERLTYVDLSTRSFETARWLVAAGVGRGTHVGLLLPNGVDFAVHALAILRIGAVAVPLSTLSSAAELELLLDRSAVRVVIAAREVRGRRFDRLLAEALDLVVPGPASVLAPAAPNLRTIIFLEPGDLDVGDDPGWRGPDPAEVERVSDDVLHALEDGVRPADPMVIVHTSGSTSAPKGVVHAHGGLLDHLAVLNELRDYDATDVLFSNSPFFWIGGFAYTFLGTLVAGATVLCSQAVEPARVLDMLERERPTMCNGYASSATALAADPTFPGRDLATMTRGNLYALMPPGSVPADPQLRANMLGLTEGGSVVLSGSVAEAEHDLPEQLRGSFGRPTPDLEGRIVEPGTERDCAPGERGELWLRGPGLMLGYHGVERSTTFDAEGWFHTGDIVHRDEHDHWYFHGRGDDLIKSAGANVSPAEVQDAVRSATGLESIVLGLPDSERGQVVAAVLLSDDAAVAATMTTERLREALAPLLSAYKLPRRVHVLPATDVPLKSSTKVDLGALRDRFEQLSRGR